MYHFSFLCNRYGKDCAYECECIPGNSRDCEPEDGTCHCAPGHVGTRCERICPPGYYGPHCQHKCTCRGMTIGFNRRRFFAVKTGVLSPN